MGGHGHGPPPDPYVVPSADSYKIEDAPELMKYQKKLEKAGLKDPWIRNYVWKYHKRYGTQFSRVSTFLLRGVPAGFVAFCITLAVENALGVDYHPWLHEHGHGEKHH